MTKSSWYACHSDGRARSTAAALPPPEPTSDRTNRVATNGAASLRTLPPGRVELLSRGDVEVVERDVEVGRRPGTVEREHAGLRVRERGAVPPDGHPGLTVDRVGHREARTLFDHPQPDGVVRGQDGVRVERVQRLRHLDAVEGVLE